MESQRTDASGHLVRDIASLVSMQFEETEGAAPLLPIAKNSENRFRAQSYETR